MKVLILYFSKTGHTLEAVNAVAEGIRSAGSEADLVTAKDFNASMLSEYDGFIVGSPCWGGSMSSDGVAKPIQKALKALSADGLAGKRCGGIAIHAKKGGETTAKTLGTLLTQKGCNELRNGPVAKAGALASLWKGPAVGAEDIALFKAYGAEFVA